MEILGEEGLKEDINPFSLIEHIALDRVEWQKRIYLRGTQDLV